MLKMKKLILVIFIILFTSFVSAGDTPFGYEVLDDNVLHFWNVHDDYYINGTSGVQLTNHYDDYWSKNVMCLGYYNGAGTWVKIRCTDEINDATKTIDTDNSSYFNATLMKDVNFAGYDFKFGVRYHLKLADEKLTIKLYLKNTGVDMPNDLGFAWIIKDVSIPEDGDDYLTLDGEHYPLNGSYDFTLSKTGNETLGNSIYLYDDEYLSLDWNENLDYKLKAYANGNQEDFYVGVLLNAGHFNSGDQKTTILKWIDASYEFKILGELIDATNLNGARFVKARGDCAYAIGYADNSLQVIDVSDPSTPVITGEYQSTAGDGNIQCPYGFDIDSDASYAYIASLCSHRVVRLDLDSNSCDDDPTLDGFYYSESGDYNIKNAGGVTVNEDDTRIYVAGYGANNVVQFDVESSGNPSPTGHYTSGTYTINPLALAERNGYVYVIGDSITRLTVLDATDPDADMTLAGSTTGDSGANSLVGVIDVVVNEDDYAYTVTTTSNCISSWNNTAHGNPVALGGICHVDYCRAARAAAISDDGNYVACAASSGDRVAVFNVTSHVPVAQATQENSAACGLDNVYGVGYNEDRLYSAAYNENNICVFEARINITTAPTDTCEYPGSGNWFINLTDNCVLETDTVVDGIIDVQGEGSLTILNCNIYGSSIWFRPTDYDGSNWIAIKGGDFAARP